MLCVQTMHLLQYATLVLVQVVVGGAVPSPLAVMLKFLNKLLVWISVWNEIGGFFWWSPPFTFLPLPFIFQFMSLWFLSAMLEAVVVEFMCVFVSASFFLAFLQFFHALWVSSQPVHSVNLKLYYRGPNQ